MCLEQAQNVPAAVDISGELAGTLMRDAKRCEYNDLVSVEHLRPTKHYFAQCTVEGLRQDQDLAGKENSPNHKINLIIEPKNRLWKVCCNSVGLPITGLAEHLSNRFRAASDTLMNLWNIWQ